MKYFKHFKVHITENAFCIKFYHVFTKPLPLLDNKRLQITNECSCISLLIVPCSQAVKPHGLLIMPDPQMGVCSAIKLRTLSVSFLISEWVMPCICRLELHFFFSKSIYRSACRCQFKHTTVLEGSADRELFYTKAAGTFRSLLLELAPSKSVWGSVFISLCSIHSGVLDEPEHGLTLWCPFACVCVSKVSFSWKQMQGGCFWGYFQNITSWGTQWVVMYRLLHQLKGSLLTARLAQGLKGLTAKELHCSGKRTG